MYLRSYEVTSPAPRVLNYTTVDVIDKRISIPAQHSLVRLSKNSATSADAGGILQEIKSGRLGGIYCVNWEIPAKRAIKFGKNWWTIIPQGEDGILMLDPDDPKNGQPLIAFRRELDPNCGLLQAEKKFTPSPTRLDVALRRVWSTYLLFRNRRLTSCARVNTQNGISAEGSRLPQLGLVPLNLTPPILCSNFPDPREVRQRCKSLGCDLFVKCDDGTEMFLTDCGRGPCPYCPPGFDELLVKGYCVYTGIVPGRWGIMLILAFGAKVGPICFSL